MDLLTMENNHKEDHITLLKLLFDEIKSGDGNSVEADAIRDRMDESWSNPSPEEQKSVRNTSSKIRAALFPESKNE